MCGNESQEFRSLPLPHRGNNKWSSRKRARTKSMNSIVGKPGTSQPHCDSLRRVTKRRKREAGKSQRIKKTSKEIDCNKLKETFNEKKNKAKDDNLAICKRKYIIDDIDNKYLENKLDGEENKNDMEDNLGEKKIDKERFDRCEKEDCEKFLKLGNYLFFRGHIKTSNEDLNEMNNIFRAETLLQSLLDSEEKVVDDKDRDNEKDIIGSNKLVEKKKKRKGVDDRDVKKQNGVTLERRGSGEWRSIQHLSKSRESVLEESDEKLYVYIPVGDNRLAEKRYSIYPRFFRYLNLLYTN